ncbi:hypothetical protein Btru_061432 [Bulinus truncatus]|nr:hypothetical protein Btru_061432 [Bulinus truncatus]
MSLSSPSTQQDKFISYMTQPRQTGGGPPRLVDKCCQALDPRRMPTYSNKLLLMVGSQSECCARTEETDSEGCNIRAPEALDAMKKNFEKNPSILWQEFAAVDGQIVQYPTAPRSCDATIHSVSLLLRESYRRRVLQPKLHLVLVVDASDEILDKVQLSFPEVSHWDIIKRAAVDVLGTLRAGDRVSIVTAGHETRSAMGCNSSLLINTRDNFDRMKIFIETTSPIGNTDYVDAFREAFSLLATQENQDKAHGISNEYINVIIFLTNAETPLVYEESLLKEVVKGQISLARQSHILVYALNMGKRQEAFKTFLMLADQNNIQLTAYDGTDNVTAESWSKAGFSKPIGPVGTFKSIPDKKTFDFSDDVVRFSTDLNLPALATLPDIFVIDPVTFHSHEGMTLHTVTAVWDASSLLGLLATNLSVDALLGGVRAFSHQTLSYAYVVERETSHALLHPRLQFQTEAASRSIAMATLQDVEPDLTSEQRQAIMASDSSNRQFIANLRPVKGSSIQTPRGCRVYHRLAAGTNFIVVMVIFDAELTKNKISAQQVPGPSSAAYHRFDQLSPSAPTCVKSGLFAQEHKIGIKFSPDLFKDRPGYLYNDGLSLQQVEDLDNFIKSLSVSPSSLHYTNVPNADTDLVTDLRAMTSQRLLKVWNDTKTTASFRFIGTPSGTFSTVPALALPDKLDIRYYQWYTGALSSQDTTLLHQEILLGPTTQIIISKAIVLAGKVLGVTGASIAGEVLKSLLYNKHRLAAHLPPSSGTPSTVYVARIAPYRGTPSTVSLHTQHRLAAHLAPSCCTPSTVLLHTYHRLAAHLAPSCCTPSTVLLHT